jgi:hypothetical protein
MPLFLLLLFCAALSAQTPQTPPSPPTLPPAAQAHLPKGWKLLELVSADLNSDGRADLVFVRAQEDPKRISKREDGFIQDNNPRALVVLLADKDGFSKVVECTKLVPPEFDPEFEAYGERFRGISVSKNVLTVSFQHWASAGSWWVDSDAFKFRLEAGRLRLIGSERETFHRSSGEMSRLSTNHLTGKVKETQGLNQFDDVKDTPVVTWKTLPSRKPIYIEDLPPCALEQ